MSVDWFFFLIFLILPSSSVTLIYYCLELNTVPSYEEHGDRAAIFSQNQVIYLYSILHTFYCYLNKEK